MRPKSTKIRDAIGNLARLFEFSDLGACADAPGFLNRAAAEITQLRASNEALVRERDSARSALAVEKAQVYFWKRLHEVENESYRKALELLSHRTYCMQRSEEEEFWCKHDGSAHSIYCPVSVAREALAAQNPSFTPPAANGETEPLSFSLVVTDTEGHASTPAEGGERLMERSRPSLRAPSAKSKAGGVPPMTETERYRKALEKAKAVAEMVVRPEFAEGPYELRMSKLAGEFLADYEALRPAEGGDVRLEGHSPECAEQLKNYLKRTAGPQGSVCICGGDYVPPARSDERNPCARRRGDEVSGRSVNRFEEFTTVVLFVAAVSMWICAYLYGP